MSRDLVLDRFFQLCRTQAEQPALWSRRADGAGVFQAISFAEYGRRVRAFGAACIGMGMKSGGVVGILGGNRPEWPIACLGVQAAGGVAAGIYYNATAEQAAYVLGHSEALVAVVEDRRQWDKIHAQRGSLPQLLRIVVMDDDVAGLAGEGGFTVGFSAFLAEGERPAGQQELAARLAALREDDLATLIYTSGTTGDPKGVMLTHNNLAWTARVASELANGYSRADCFVSYLPLAHIAEQMFTVYLAASGGLQVYFAGGIERLRETLLQGRPTALFGVPRVWEKLKAALEARLAEQRGWKAKLVAWAREVALRAGQKRLEEGPPTGLLALQEKLAERLVFRKLKAALGFDRLRYAVSGAAPVGRDVMEFFLSLQIPIYEVYGQSEDTGPTTFNRPLPGQTRLGTVGRPIPGIEVKLAQDGEILVKGPNVCAGYYKDPEATRATLVDGWLHSGDVGEFDRDGFLRITDRKKDLIKTAGGKYIAPQHLEKLLRALPLVSQAMVIGERRRYVTALLTLEPSAAEALQRGGKEEIHATVQAHVEQINGTLARVESIKRFTLLATDFSVEAGELTPTQKLRRRAVELRYAAQIEAMYQDEGDPREAP